MEPGVGARPVLKAILRACSDAGVTAERPARCPRLSSVTRPPASFSAATISAPYSGPPVERGPGPTGTGGPPVERFVDALRFVGGLSFPFDACSTPRSAPPGVGLSPTRAEGVTSGRGLLELATAST